MKLKLGEFYEITWRDSSNEQEYTDIGKAITAPKEYKGDFENLPWLSVLWTTEPSGAGMYFFAEESDIIFYELLTEEEALKRMMLRGE